MVIIFQLVPTDLQVSLCYKIVRGSYEHIPDQYSNLVKMLVEKSLQKSPEARPT